MAQRTNSYDSGAGTSSPVTITFANLRNERGVVRLCLTGNRRHFPDCSGDANARTMTVPASATTVQFANVAPGTYAVSMIHDENANGRMDMRLFVPREGFGFSRNPAVRMGPPSFGSAAFAVGDTPVTQHLRMRYMF